MSKYNSVKDLNFPYDNQLAELIPLLELLESINPCGQEYEVVDDNIVISYFLKLNLFNFRNIFPLRARVQIIGLPISFCIKGFIGNEQDIEKIVKNRKGLKVILNSDSPFKGGGRTLSTFVFENSYSSFEEYLGNLRSPYRRRINKALKSRELFTIRKLPRQNFSQEHYKLYLSIMNRTENPLETLPIEFFQQYEAEIHEFVDIKTDEIIGFIQTKEIDDKLYFIFGGFEREDIERYDIYYNMLLKIIELGIEKGMKEIEFGQTAEESKLKIGCQEKYKYLYIHHSNPLINFFIQLLVPLFTYKPYPKKHRVFKNNED
jgi:hypothetical protein